MFALVIENLNQIGFPWPVFWGLVAAVLMGLVAVFFWVLFFKNKKKRKRKHRGHRRIKPTLAQSGGLPPVRQPGERHYHNSQPFDP
jgi:O-antigen/teichoic acid export membrane protein